MYPVEIISEAFKKAGSINALAQRALVSDQAVRNWLNLSCAPNEANLKQLLAIATGSPAPAPISSWEKRQQEIETRGRYKPPVVEAPVYADPKPAPKKSWKQRIEITRIHENADFAFGVTDDALIAFIVPHVTDKLKDAGMQNGDEITVVVRENEHHAADLYAFKWIEDDEDGY
jgi:hypothetical protein